MRRLFHILLYFLGAALLLAVIGAGVGMWIWQGYEKQARTFDLTKIGEIPQRSAVYDVSGNLYSYIDGENRLIVPLHRVSPLFIKALLAREDSRFYQHHGVDYHGIIRAALTNLRHRGIRQGASTITQQLARNSFPLGGQTLGRKLLEAALAQRIEREFPKEKILEFYVNRIYYGAGVYGIETASRAYFGKPSAELDLSESALMAGIIRSPNRNSPLTNIQGALEQRDQVLDRMAELKMVPADEAKLSKATNLFVFKKHALTHQENYAMDAVRRDLDVILSPEQADQGGLKIYTTIDPALQEAATKAVDEKLTEIEQQSSFKHPKKAEFTADKDENEEKPTDYLQGALVAIDNRTGAIRALVGGRDFQQSRYNRALMSRRQVGSTFKPFIYTAAFERGLLPGTLVDDSEIKPGEFANVSNKWSPENSDGEYLGMQPAAVGLIRSRNTMTVRVGESLGLPAVQKVAMQLGLGEKLPDFPVIFLGAFETTLKDLTDAYTVFPNGGTRKQAYLIARIEDYSGQTIYKAAHVEAQTFSPESAWLTSTALQQVMKNGTAAKAKSLGWNKPAAGKTGTTNDYHDAWFVGYTSSLTCGVWVGFDHPQTIMEKGYGATLALPVWIAFMNKAPAKQYPAEELKAPGELRKVHLCAASGAIATAGCDAAHESYDADLPEARVPKARCTLHPEPQPALIAAGAAAPAVPAVLRTTDSAISAEPNVPPSPNIAASTMPAARPNVATAVPAPQPVVAAKPVAPPPVAVTQPSGRKTLIFQAPNAPDSADTTEEVVEPRRSVNAIASAPGSPRIRREEEQSTAVPVMRAEPVRPAVPSERRQTVPVRRAEPIETDSDLSDQPPPQLRRSQQQQPVAESEDNNRPHGRVKQRIIKTRVYPDGHEEQEVIEVR